MPILSVVEEWAQPYVLIPYTGSASFSALLNNDCTLLLPSLTTSQAWLDRKQIGSKKLTGLISADKAGLLVIFPDRLLKQK